MYKIAVDIGGTFTDIVLTNGREAYSEKVLTTTFNPEIGAIKGIQSLLKKIGVSINEINTVRKHISNIKGGRLAKLANPSTCYSLIISDVIYVFICVFIDVAACFWDDSGMIWASSGHVLAWLNV